MRFLTLRERCGSALRWLVPCFAALVFAAAACSGFLGPDRGDPAQFAFADSVRFGCGYWFPSPPDTEFGLFDIPGGLTGPGEPEALARQRLLDDVLGAGGTIVRRYNLLMVRAILPISSVSQLQFFTLHGVVQRELSRTTFRVFVGFRDGIAPSAIESRGGSILQVYDALDMVLAIFPDGEVPALRRDPRVLFVEHALGIDCPG